MSHATVAPSAGGVVNYDWVLQNDITLTTAGVTYTIEIYRFGKMLMANLNVSGNATAAINVGLSAAVNPTEFTNGGFTPLIGSSTPTTIRGLFICPATVAGSSVAFNIVASSGTVFGAGIRQTLIIGLLG